jgi:hypothetical protein
MDGSPSADHSRMSDFTKPLYLGATQRLSMPKKDLPGLRSPDDGGERESSL